MNKREKNADARLLITPPARGSAGMGVSIESLLPDIRKSIRLACSLHMHRAQREELDDLCSEILMLLMENDYRRLRSFNHKSSIKTWLSTVVTRHVGRHLRKHNAEVRLEEISLDSIVCVEDQHSFCTSDLAPFEPFIWPHLSY